MPTATATALLAAVARHDGKGVGRKTRRFETAWYLQVFVRVLEFGLCVCVHLCV